MKKRELITMIERLNKQGYPATKDNYTVADDYTELKEEYERLKSDKEIQTAIKSYGRYVVHAASAIEYTNKLFDPFGHNDALDGWSETVENNLDEYEDVFTELYIKYKDALTVAPEIKLLGMFVFSGFSFWVSKIAIEKASDQMPGFKDIMDHNPELKRQYEMSANDYLAKKGADTPVASAMDKMGMGGIGNLLGGLLGGGSKPPPQQQKSQPQQQSQSKKHPQQQQSPKQKSQKPHMEGPTNVDDLFSHLKSKSSDTQEEETLDIDEDLSEFTAKR